MPFTLLLLPGLAGDATMWRDQVSALARWQPVVTDVHMREPTIPDMARALLREHAGPLALCGASMGGMVAMEAARQAPDRIVGLALLGTSAEPENDEMRAVRESAMELFAQGRMAEVIEPNVHFAFDPANAQRPELVQAYLDFVYRCGADQLIRQNRAVIARPDARLHLPQIRCPMLVMIGESDQLTPPAKGEAIAALVPQAQLVRVASCGHMLTMEQPAVVNAALAGWLEGLG